MRKKEIEDVLLKRGVVDVIGKDELLKKLLETPEKVIIKYGVDPTRPDIHLGHLVCLRKLRQFQELGCKVIFLAGDLTAQIGDPTGKSKVRPELDLETVSANMATFLKQIGKFLICDNKEKDVFEWIRNSDWYTAITDIKPFAKDEIYELTLPDIISKEDVVVSLPGDHIIGAAMRWFKTRMLLSKKEKAIRYVSTINLLAFSRYVTHSQLIDRDMFQERIKKNEPLFMHEMFYPILQGIDSKVICEVWGTCDLEIGGTDQHFNMLMGRDLMKVTGQKPQSVMTLNILEGTDGKEKMSKSLDNYIAVNESPKEIFGKIMSIPDNIMSKYFELLTDLSRHDIDQLLAGHPRDAKLRLAEEMVTMLHNKEAAHTAREEFLKIFSEGGLPHDIPEMQLPSGEYRLLELVIRSELCESNADARRQITQGAVKIDDTRLNLLDEPVLVNDDPKILQIGKRKFIRFVAG